MKALGVNLSGFDKPVCNSFVATVRDDQLCYSIDLEKYRDDRNILNQLETGLIFAMDYNEDRQVPIDDEKTASGKNARIFIDTIGKYIFVSL